MFPELVILSQDRACAYEPTGREVCISIRDPRREPPELSSGFVSILRLTFTDIAKPSPFDWDLLFNEDHAREIINFVRKWRHAERIVVHCMAGQGRSPGVGMALCELFGWASVEVLEKQHPLWNTWVREELVRVGREVLQTS